jgi:hypothetical protein
MSWIAISVGVSNFILNAAVKEGHPASIVMGQETSLHVAVTAYFRALCIRYQPLARRLYFYPVTVNELLFD